MNNPPSLLQNANVFARSDATRAHDLLKRAVLFKSIYSQRSEQSINFYKYCQRTIDDSPEYLASYEGKPHLYTAGIATFKDLTSSVEQHSIADQSITNTLTEEEADDLRFWSNHGFLYKPGFFPDLICDLLCNELSKKQYEWDVYSYSHIPHIMDLYASPQLNRIISLVTGVKPVLYMSLHTLKSSARAWHQDEYFSYGRTQGSSFAVWIALDDITPQMGPYLFLPGSHKYPILDMSKLFNYLSDSRDYIIGKNIEDRFTYAAAVTAPAYEMATATDQSYPLMYLPRKGDLFLWHSRLLHRALPPGASNISRPGLIGHYCALSDLPVDQQKQLQTRSNLYYAEATNK